MLTSYDGGAKFLSGATIADFASAPSFLPKHDGWERSHYEEWIAACKGGPKPVSNFDVSGPVSETILLGNVALRTGQKIHWNSATLKADAAAANALVTKTYRPGFGV